MRVTGGKRKSLVEKQILRQIREREDDSQSLDSTPPSSLGGEEWLNKDAPSDADDASLSDESSFHIQE